MRDISRKDRMTDSSWNVSMETSFQWSLAPLESLRVRFFLAASDVIACQPIKVEQKNQTGL